MLINFLSRSAWPTFIIQRLLDYHPKKSKRSLHNNNHISSAWCPSPRKQQNQLDLDPVSTIKRLINPFNVPSNIDDNTSTPLKEAYIFEEIEESHDPFQFKQQHSKSGYNQVVELTITHTHI